MMCTWERGYNMTNSKTTKAKALRASDESFESIQQMAKENGKTISATIRYLIMSLLGLGLNLSGIGNWLDQIGIGGIITETTGFLSQPISAMMIFSVVKKPVDNEEFETESYTLTDDKGNVISLTYEKNRELSFTMIDYLAFSPEELETMGIPQELYDSMMEGIANATKQHGTLLSFYEIQVENDDGFLIHEGPFYIKIKMTDEMKKYDIFKIVYIDVEDNLATESPITLTQEGGYLVGTLEHLSTYALVGDNGHIHNRRI